MKEGKNEGKLDIAKEKKRKEERLKEKGEKGKRENCNEGKTGHSKK